MAHLKHNGEVLPLFHHCYAGNKHHSTIFGALIQQIAKSCRAMARGVSDLSLVFDKGNNSKDNLTETADSGLHFVGSWMIPTRPGVSARRVARRSCPSIISDGTLKGSRRNSASALPRSARQPNEQPISFIWSQ
jgi:hypothetical protein